MSLLVWTFFTASEGEGICTSSARIQRGGEMSVSSYRIGFELLFNIEKHDVICYYCYCYWP